MRDIISTGGQESMEKIIVETTPVVAERLDVFRATPFEFDVTAPSMASTSVVGRTTVIGGEGSVRYAPAIEASAPRLTTDNR